MPSSSQIDEIGIRLRADGVVELTNGMRLSADAVAQLGQRLDQAAQPLARLEAGGTRTAAAVATVPGELARLVAGLATGQAGLAGTALATGQLQGALAGLGPAGQLAVGALTPVAAAVAALGVAYAQGSGEQDKLHRSLVATGNAAGTTLGELVAMAQGVDAVVATQARATDVLAALVATSTVAGQDLRKFTEVALQAERVTGQAAEEIVKQLAELGRAPVQASVRLNESTHHLTVALYEQIRALQEQGRISEAASLAQNAWADATRTRTAELETRLGLLQRGWHTLRDAARDAWDAMLNVGRPATLEEQLATAQKQLAELPEPRRGTNAVVGQQRRDALRQHVDDLRLQIYLQREAAAADSAAADATRRHIDEREKRQPRAGGAGRTARDEPERGWSAYRTWGDAGRAEVAWPDQQARQAERAKAIEHTAQLSARQADALEREAAALANHTAEIGLDAGAVTERRQALLDEQIAQVASQLAVVEGAAAYDQHTQALQRQLAALGRLKALQQEAADKTMVEGIRKARARQEQEDAADARRRTERLSDSIEEGILNGYRAGRSASDIFLAELKAQFARTVLRPIISPVAQGISDLLGNLARGLGLGGQAAGATSAASFMADANTMAGLFHSGGVPAADGAAATRALPASTWAGAPRFHTGIGPDEVPAVLQRTEGVFTAGQMKALAPVASLERAAGVRINFSPVYNIDARTDGAQVLALVQGVSRQAQAELLDMMDRRMA